MPLTQQEGIGLGVGILNIWDKHVTAHTLSQMEQVIKQYTDDRIVAYLHGTDDGLGIRVVSLKEYKALRAKIKLTESGLIL